MPLLGTDTLLATTMFSLLQVELLATGTPPTPEALKQLKALCNAIAKAVVPHIVANAQVAPGIPTAGSPAAQVTTLPGFIL